MRMNEGEGYRQREPSPPSLSPLSLPVDVLIRAKFKAARHLVHDHPHDGLHEAGVHIHKTVDHEECTRSAEPEIGYQGRTVLDEPERPKHGEEIKLNGLHTGTQVQVRMLRVCYAYVMNVTKISKCQTCGSEMTPSVRTP